GEAGQLDLVLKALREPAVAQEVLALGRHPGDVAARAVVVGHDQPARTDERRRAALAEAQRGEADLLQPLGGRLEVVGLLEPRERHVLEGPHAAELLVRLGGEGGGEQDGDGEGRGPGHGEQGERVRGSSASAPCYALAPVGASPFREVPRSARPDAARRGRFGPAAAVVAGRYSRNSRCSLKRASTPRLPTGRRTSVPAACSRRASTRRTDSAVVPFGSLTTSGGWPRRRCITSGSSPISPR